MLSHFHTKTAEDTKKKINVLKLPAASYGESSTVGNSVYY